MGQVLSQRSTGNGVPKCKQGPRLPGTGPQVSASVSTLLLSEGPCLRLSPARAARDHDAPTPDKVRPAGLFRTNADELKGAGYKGHEGAS
jgi:hypothetical protein